MLIIMHKSTLFKWHCLRCIWLFCLIVLSKPALLQILKERYGIKSILNHYSGGSTWSGLSKWYLCDEESNITYSVTDRLAGYPHYFDLKKNSSRKKKTKINAYHCTQIHSL